MISVVEVLIICAESEARKNEPLLNIEADVSLEPASADSGDEADGREVEIVSLTFMRSAAYDLLLDKITSINAIKLTNNIFFCISNKTQKGPDLFCTEKDLLVKEVSF